MTVDPTDPETFDESAGTGAPDPEERDAEAPDADTAEQRTDVVPERDDPLNDADADRADEADLAEQARVVSHDEDDYR